MFRVICLLAICFSLLKHISAQQYGKLKDTRDGKVYKTIKIGIQVWMAENLNTVTFRNGDPIKEAKSLEEWNQALEKKVPAWCHYNNDPLNGYKYGKLYNWYAVNDIRGLAPPGWHVPNEDDWASLRYTLGDEQSAGYKLKTKDGWKNGKYPRLCTACENWDSNKRNSQVCATCNNETSILSEFDGNGSNTTGFSALPGGTRFNNLTFNFDGIGTSGGWWSSTFYENKLDESHYYYILHSNYDWINRRTGKGINDHGYSVRCIKD